MMLRTTISRIRKVWSVVFIPRIGRGDPCSAVSNAVIRKAHKGSKSTEDGEQGSTKKPDLHLYKFPAPDIRTDEHFKKIMAGPKKPKILTAGLPLTHRERCQKIIDQAFGNSDETEHDHGLSQQYFSHTVNLEDTRREIHESEKAKLKLQEQEMTDNTNSLLPDDRSQYGIFQISRENYLNDDQIIVPRSALAKEPDLTKNLEHVKGTAEETPSVEEPNVSDAKEDFDKSVSNPESKENKALCDDAERIEVVKDEKKPAPYHISQIYPHHIPCFLNTTTTREHLTYANEAVDTSVNNPESVENKALCDNAETIKIVKNERTHNLDQETPPNAEHDTYQVLSTTEKQDEELLTQKLETIEETPIVEAHKPKLEDTVTPKVLGNKPTLNCTVKQNTQENCPYVDLPGALDEVSKRCLNYPIGQIDEMLLDEMEKLGMTYKTAQVAPSPAMENDLVQMGEPEIDSERPELEEKETAKATDTRLFDIIEQHKALRNYPENVEPTTDLKLERNYAVSFEPTTDLNLESCRSEEYNPDPDCNSTTNVACNSLPPSYRAAELDKQEQMQTTVNTSFEKVPDSDLPDQKCNEELQELSKISLPTVDDISQQCSNKLYSAEKIVPTPVQESEKPGLPEELLEQRMLDPYYVLTCNETCPISPGTTMSTGQNSDFVDTTETIYMKKNICESLRPRPQKIIKCEQTSQVRPNDIIIEGMPEVDEQVSLTELLRRVRERSRLVYTQSKKCPKSPHCNPVGPRSPPNNPVPLPTFGLPMLKRRPPVCKPKKKPVSKCSRATNFPEMPYDLNETEVCAVKSNFNITDEFIDRLQNLGKIFGGGLRHTKSNVDMLARDYEPWTPIPSWNIPLKRPKKEWQPGMTGVPPCVKGCPYFPKARASMNPEPPCTLKPCEGFPKRRSFSMLDCFAVSLGENKVYYLGDF